MKVYAFDVDETLEISGGPIKLSDLVQLKQDGHVVGLCGNWAVVTTRLQNWQFLISFISLGDKAEFLQHIRPYMPAEDHVMVGNVLGISGASDDKGAADRAGWRFIKESDFAEGIR